MQFDVVGARVVGSLVEKELTTPQQYPLTLNALVVACNQTSNRDPVMHLSETEIQGALDSLKATKVVRFVFPSHGRSAIRYRHVLDEVLGLDERQRALVAVLLLRGAQTLGELRTRTDRMAEFAGLGDVESELRRLAGRDEPLVVRLERRPGQKEERYMHLLAGPPAVEPASPEGRAAGGGWPASAAGRPEPAAGALAGAIAAAPAIPGVAAGSGPSFGDDAIVAAGAPGAAPPGDVADLRAAVDDLRREVASMRSELDELRASLGG